jgi:branched-subunit amino acid aminotransferase/4-amino-4-deoxychorismate lyase
MTTNTSESSETLGVHSAVRTFRLVAGQPVELAIGHGSLDQVSQALPEGVYTTFRTYPGERVLHLVDHLERLTASARREGHALALDHRRARTALAQTLLQVGYPLARVRFTLTYDPPGDLYISLEPFVPLPERAYQEGVAVVTAPPELRRINPEAKATRFIAPGAKARAEHRDNNEVLLVSEAGEILEGSSSNFFGVLHTSIYTAERGVLAGVTRAMVLRLAATMAPVVRQAVRLQDIPALTEAFITSVSRAVLPVTYIDGSAVGAGVPGPLTRRLMEAFEAELDRELERIEP